MPTRRDVLSAGGLVLAGFALGGCGSRRDEYAAAADRVWRRNVAIPATVDGILNELVRIATLAPSTFNSQCWKFRASREGITILPDPDRRSPAADPDDHHLFVSLGCAAENIVQSAATLGLYSHVQTGTAPDDGLTVSLEVGVPARSQLADAIPLRQTTRANFYGKPVPSADLARLERVSRAPGVTPVLVTGAAQKGRLLELATVANRAWYASPARVAELERWTRFDDASALATRDGLAPGPAGRTSLPPPVGRALFRLLAASDRNNDRLVTAVRSSAGLAAFVSAHDDRTHWVETGRALQRFALLATALGIRHDWVNAPADLPEFRPQLGMELGEPAGRPGVLVRFGYGPLRPRSLRRVVTGAAAEEA
jgi:nitroreductase